MMNLMCFQLEIISGFLLIKKVRFFSYHEHIVYFVQLLRYINTYMHTYI